MSETGNWSINKRRKFRAAVRGVRYIVALFLLLMALLPGLQLLPVGVIVLVQQGSRRRIRGLPKCISTGGPVVIARRGYQFWLTIVKDSRFGMLNLRRTRRPDVAITVVGSQRCG
jgi:hypothetical protein